MTGPVRIRNLAPWGGSTLVILDRHPLRGPGTRMHGLPVDCFVAVRNGMMLTKLARIAVREHPVTAPP
ncbi:hypothetical protein [Streptomyces virginiae]|uniref:hypothetical protein n=1 Tax=Streptomyces virginiae TaxID=1961 RepID=UPI003D3240C2